MLVLGIHPWRVRPRRKYRLHHGGVDIDTPMRKARIKMDPQKQPYVRRTYGSCSIVAPLSDIKEITQNVYGRMYLFRDGALHTTTVQRKFHLDHDGACLERAGLILVTPWAAERYQPASPATQLIERVFLELIGHGPTLEQQRESTA